MVITVIYYLKNPSNFSVMKTYGTLVVIISQEGGLIYFVTSFEEEPFQKLLRFISKRTSYICGALNNLC